MTSGTRVPENRYTRKLFAKVAPFPRRQGWVFSRPFHVDSPAVALQPNADGWILSGTGSTRQADDSLHTAGVSMSLAYHRLEESLKLPTVSGVSIPLEIAGLVLRNRDVRRAVAQVFVDAKRKRVHLVLWVGVDPRWVAQVVYGLLGEYLPEASTSRAQRKRLVTPMREAKCLAC